MGLDQYAYAMEQIPDQSVDFEEPDDAEQIAQWRKHPYLQGWMEKLYLQRGGVGAFDCRPVALTLEDLDQLEADVRAGALPETSGFFFGDDSSAEYREYDLQFIERARQEIEAGRCVYYSSWW